MKQLGYRDTYHYSSIALENIRDAEMWWVCNREHAVADQLLTSAKQGRCIPPRIRRQGQTLHSQRMGPTARSLHGAFSLRFRFRVTTSLTLLMSGNHRLPFSLLRAFSARHLPQRQSHPYHPSSRCLLRLLHAHSSTLWREIQPSHLQSISIALPPIHAEVGLLRDESPAVRPRARY